LQVDQAAGLTVLRKSHKKVKSTETSAETQMLLDEASQILHSNDKPVEEPVKEEVAQDTTTAPAEIPVAPKVAAVKPK
jgi:hypothetical protein